MRGPPALNGVRPTFRREARGSAVRAGAILRWHLTGGGGLVGPRVFSCVAQRVVVFRRLGAHPGARAVLLLCVPSWLLLERVED